MREYKIANSSLGYKIYRKKEENGIMNMEWLHKDWYCLNIEDAKVFYSINDAMSSLVIERMKCRKEETPQKTSTTSTRKSESEEKREKKSWDEL